MLDNVAAILKRHPEVAKVLVEGYTDDVGDDAKNMALSDRRANAVLEYLVKQGIARDRLESKGFGETLPIAENKTAEGRATNRRVEFKITGADGAVKIK